jgi:hypothetical protein
MLRSQCSNLPNVHGDTGASSSRACFHPRPAKSCASGLVGTANQPQLTHRILIHCALRVASRLNQADAAEGGFLQSANCIPAPLSVLWRAHRVAVPRLTYWKWNQSGALMLTIAVTSHGRGSGGSVATSAAKARRRYRRCMVCGEGSMKLG